MTEKEAMEIQEAALRIYNNLPKTRRTKNIRDLGLIQHIVTAIMRDKPTTMI